MSSVFTDSFTTCIPIWMPFIYLSSPIALARTSSTVLNRGCEIVHLISFSDFRGKAFSLSS